MVCRTQLIPWAVVLLIAGGSPAEAITVPGNYPTIQAAINAVLSGAAPNGSIIDVLPGTYREALQIVNTSKSMTLRGVGGAPSTVVDAVGLGRSALRIVRASGAIRIEGLTFKRGTGVSGAGGGFLFMDASPAILNVVFEQNVGFDGGGGVLARSNATFENCAIRNNSAARFGGGMVITTGSRPTFTKCQIQNNVSGTGGPGVGSIGSGGGVHVNDSSPTFRGCLIAGNRSKFAAGGILVIGLFNSSFGPSHLVLEDTEVSGNRTDRFSPADNPAEGGGVHVEDNAVGHLIRARILGNTANTSGGLSAYRARYEITSSIIQGNHAQDPQGVGGFGGGIGASSNNPSTPLRQAASIALTDSFVRSNDARIGGGIFITGDQLCGSTSPVCNPATALHASLHVTDSVVADNTAGLSAGGMRVDRTDLTISNSLVLRNSVSASGSSFGGGILLSLQASASLTNTTIAGNAAVDFGGGLFIDNGATVNVSNSRVYDNTAGSGGGVYVGSTGPPSGIVQNSVIADNGSFQIHEQACNPLQRTILRYQNNIITPAATQNDIYRSTCGGDTTSISAFNSLPSGRTSGNSSATPSFAAFLAAPSIGPTSLLAWSVARATQVDINGGGNFSGTASAVVAPTSTTNYVLTSTGGPSTPTTRTVTVPPVFGGADDTPVPADFDGDGRKDLAVYRPATGQWFILRSSAGFRTLAWGSPAHGDVPVAADYDGDGKGDVAVFRNATGEWLISRSAGGGALILAWGAPALGDVPVPADYDGDGKDDIAVFRRTTGEWFVRKSTGGTLHVAWGAPSLGDVPVPADYDGDDKTDVAIYRTSTAQWYIRRSTGGTTIVTWGSPALGDTPVPADYDDDGKADIAVARQLTGEWFVRRSSGGSRIEVVGFGDARVPGDFNGDGNAEPAIWRAASGSWFIQR